MPEAHVTLVLEREAEGTRAALLENGNVVSFYYQPRLSDVRVGDLFVGRVLQNRLSQVGWFIDLGNGKSGFLPRHKCRRGDKPAAGERLLVQVDKDEQNGKVPELTENIQIKGKLLIFLPLSPYIAVSRRIPEDQRIALKQQIAAWCAEGEGAIVRTRAASCGLTALHTEFDTLKDKWLKVRRDQQRHAAHAPVLRQFSFPEALLNENHFPSNPTVVANYPIKKTELPSGATIIYKPEEQLFHQQNLEEIYQAALQSNVPLASGASLVIDYTDTLTAIDVNSGSAAFQQDWEQTALQINLSAAKEIAVQLRLRQIGGMIIIDFLRLKKEEDRLYLLQKLEEATNKDPNPIRIYGFTRLGLVEMIRKRQRCGLKEYALQVKKTWLSQVSGDG